MILIVLDENGEPEGLLDEFFYSWARLDDKKYLITYRQNLDFPHYADLHQIQEKTESDVRDITPEELISVKGKLDVRNYPLTVDCGETVKRLMLAEFSKGLIENPYVVPVLI